MPPRRPRGRLRGYTAEQRRGQKIRQAWRGAGAAAITPAASSEKVCAVASSLCHAPSRSATRYRARFRRRPRSTCCHSPYVGAL